jgi:glycosyltransferase involved in cell wall biosynthesis
MITLGRLASRRNLHRPLPHPPHVLHTVPALFDSKGDLIGGGERYAYELARYMARLVPTSLISFGDKDDSFRDGDLAVRIIGSPYRFRGHWMNPVSFDLLAAAGDFDVVHCHQRHVLMSTLTAFAFRVIGPKVFVTDHGGGAWDISNRISTTHWYRGHLHDSKYSVEVASHQSGVRAHVIYGGVDNEKFSPASSGTERSGAALFVGRLLPHKGVNELIEACIPDVPLQIIGKPHHEPYMRVLSELAARGKVTFNHRASDADIVAAYRAAVCIVLPSVYRTMFGDETRVPELLGQTLLEGMACGTPAICTDVGAMPEVVEHGVSGFVVPPHRPDLLRERILWLRDHPTEAASMGRAARQRVLEHFTWPSVARHCLRIYREG